MSKIKTIYASEWSILKAEQIKDEYGEINLKKEDYTLINELEDQRKIKVKQLSDGIEIETYSYVGVLRFSDFQVIISPKIEDVYLAKMISYSYNLGKDDIKYFDPISNLGTKRGAITDIIALLYIKEVEQIFLKGLARRYKQKEETLSTCRGKIMFNDLARRSNAKLTLPCRYRDLTTDIAENRLIYSTLKILKNQVNSKDILTSINVFIEKLSDKITHKPLNKHLFNKVNKENNRLTKHYEKAIKLSLLIYENHDFSLNTGKITFQSFLIDMNILFEKFLFQIFKSSFKDNFDISYQRKLGNSYLTTNNKKHNLLPDYQFFKDDKLFGIADAKYKDYNNKNVSTGDLYQLTVYSIANKNNINNIMLFYPTKRKQRITQYSLTDYFSDRNIVIIAVGVPLIKAFTNMGEYQTRLKRLAYDYWGD